jgi:hypothetical protein
MFELSTLPHQRVRAANMAIRTLLSFRTSLSVLAIICCSFIVVGAQTRPQNLPTPPESINVEKPKSQEDKLVLGSMDEEMRVKQNIKLLEKEYKQNVDRAREVSELGAELRDAVKEGKPFGREEAKKLERLEKLAKKIRSEAGGSEEETALSNPPGKLESALSKLAEVAESLRKVVEKTPRQVISAAVIEKANVLLQLTRITRNLFH